MKTVKQVSDLTGISVRTLHYYDEIELLKPSEITKSGYRLYDDEDIKTLQQILFFKELDIPLKDVKNIILSPYFDKMQALKNQKKLLILKRKRLDGLIDLINKTLKGANTMSFKEFDMTEYYNVLENFKKYNKDRIIKNWGSVDKYDEMIEKMKDNETKVAKNIIKQYGSIKKCAEATKNDLNNDELITRREKYDKFKNDFLYDKHPKLKELYKKLTMDLNKDSSSKEVQEIAKEITDIAKKDYEIFKKDRGDDAWYYMMTNPLEPKWIDKKYGKDASKFIGETFKIHLQDKQPKLEILYKKLTDDISKNPTSKEIQKIVFEIADITKKNYEFYKGNTGLDFKGFFSVMSDIYLSNNDEGINAVDEIYGKGSSKFIGEALKFYSEHSK